MSYRLDPAMPDAFAPDHWIRLDEVPADLLALDSAAAYPWFVQGRALQARDHVLQDIELGAHAS